MLDQYKIKYPTTKILCSDSSKRKSKTEAQKLAQSETLKARFETPAGEITRQQISEASRRLMQTEYRDRAASHLRSLNKDPKQRDYLREVTSSRWEEGGDLRETVPRWHQENREKSLKMAAHARSHVDENGPSQMHLDFKSLMVKSGLDGFKTEYETCFYSIDEAHPEVKLAVEIDGCYWHSCPECELEGPNETSHTDARKTSYLLNRGWTILRFWGHEIRNDPEGCIERIKIALEDLT